MTFKLLDPVDHQSNQNNPEFLRLQKRLGLSHKHKQIIYSPTCSQSSLTRSHSDLEWSHSDLQHLENLPGGKNLRTTVRFVSLLCTYVARSWEIVSRSIPEWVFWSMCIYPTESRKNCSPQCSEDALKRLLPGKPNLHQLCNIHNEN